MLEIKNISKTYKTGELVQVALDDVSLNLRDNEFVAILGPSGSGKTTLLNIIGGLDHYDSGDLIINHVSTKNYKDRDWDAYRNHTIGFVFQSYNLIPHQTILSNVELALTIAGITKAERRKRALEALDAVGLKEQAHKRPNQMSGGQMQRVAIARALINNPDILLADEPTGALDTATSLQVMDLLQKVAKDRLVVMVTHNPELAEEYANRIVRLKDGKITDDTNPYIAETKEATISKRLGKAKMSFLTALSLSFNNLLTKKGRTILTAFAGSIGIIGIALILSLSQGFQNYIDKIQEDTLSSYPLTITSETADATAAILSMVSDRQNAQKEGDVVNEQRYLSTMFSAIGTNDLKSFKKYLEDHDEVNDYVSQIRYSYSITPLIYTIDATDKLAKLNPNSMMSVMTGGSGLDIMSTLSSSYGGIFSEMSDDFDSIEANYDVLAGKWPSNYDEMVIVLSEPNYISDLLVYSLGLRDTAELKEMITILMAGEEWVNKDKPKVFSYEDLLNIELKLVNPADMFKYNPSYNIYEDMSSDEDYMRDVYDRSARLKIVGIVCAKPDNSSMVLSPGVAYTRDLTKHVIEEASKKAIVAKQLSNSEVDVFSNKRFDEEEKENEPSINFEDMITVDESMIKDAFKINIDQSSFISDDQAKQIVMSSAEKAAQTLQDTSGNLILMINTLDTAISQMMITSFQPMQMAVLMQNPDSITCPDGYLNPFVKMMGCAVLPGNEENYVTYNFEQFGLEIKLFKDQEIPFDKETLKTYKEDFFANPMIISAIEEMLKQSTETSAMDAETLIKITKSFADQAFDNYAAKVVTHLSADGKTVTTLQELSAVDVSAVIAETLNEDSVKSMILGQAASMVEEYTSLIIAGGIAEATGKIMEPLSTMFSSELFTIDTDKFAQAFQFNMSEDELSRLMETMMTKSSDKTAKTNLLMLGYQDMDDPTSISFYFKDFDTKESFLAFLDEYNENVNNEEKEIKYTDITGILMSSVKTIVDSVTYVLIAFVSISLIVSSIMIAVITLISVMERTKEIGILRAMGASKKNVSSIFNAETFIIGLLSGILGIGTTLALIPPINALIHNVTGNYDINAVLPTKYALILILISVILTIFAGIIPSRKASKQDPVIALRTE